MHFFDVDQTKTIVQVQRRKGKTAGGERNVPLRRAVFDAPTIVGGVREHLMDENVIVVIDVGGDHLGARLIGGFAPLLNREFTQNFFCYQFLQTLV